MTGDRRTEGLLEQEIKKTCAWDSTYQIEDMKRQRAGA